MRNLKPPSGSPGPSNPRFTHPIDNEGTMIYELHTSGLPDHLLVIDELRDLAHGMFFHGMISKLIDLPTLGHSRACKETI